MMRWVRDNIGDTVYGRVDLVLAPNDGLRVMELELIEPWLYFSTDCPGHGPSPGLAEFVDLLGSLAEQGVSQKSRR